MPRSKTKPAARRLKRAAVDLEKAAMLRWQAVADKHPEGSLIRTKALANVRLAELRLEELRGWVTP